MTARRIGSEWKLRREAELRDFPTSHTQLRGYIRWGMVQDRVDGTWPSDAVERVIEARKLETRARPLCRRALLMARTRRISPSILREAMIRTLPSIKAPKRKMARITKAVHWQASQEFYEPGYPQMNFPRPRLGPVDPKEWRDILSRSDVDDRHFGETVSLVATFDLFLEQATRSTPVAVSSIPTEERLILLAIRQLARLAKSKDIN